MRIEVGMEAYGLRMTLTLQSIDVETHSVMTDQKQYFEELASQLSEIGCAEIKKLAPPKRKIY